MAGPGSIGIGGDYNGVSQFPSGLEDVSGFPRVFQALIDDQVSVCGYVSWVKQFITDQTHSWTEAELAGLAGGNLLRVMGEVERVSEELREAGVRPDNTWIHQEEL